jgi:hypothetical protein
MLLDAAIINVWILCEQADLDKLNNKLTHASFQEDVAYALLENPSYVLRQRLQESTEFHPSPPPPHKAKGEYMGHKWDMTPGKWRKYTVCDPNKLRRPLEELSGNSTLRQDGKRPAVPRTTYFYMKCGTSLCFNSPC